MKRKDLLIDRVAVLACGVPYDGAAYGNRRKSLPSFAYRLPYREFDFKLDISCVRGRPKSVGGANNEVSRRLTSSRGEFWTDINYGRYRTGTSLPTWSSLRDWINEPELSRDKRQFGARFLSQDSSRAAPNSK